MADGHGRLVAPGRHTRRPGRAGLRRVSLAALIMLVAQYGLGIFLNLYVAIPASDAHASIFGEIATAPLSLTVHALLGLALIGTAILLVVRAIGVRDRLLAVLAAAGLLAIVGAFGAGEMFVRNGQSSTSLAMAILTAVALLCYVGTLALASAAQRQAVSPQPHPAPAAPAAAPWLATPPRPRPAAPARPRPAAQPRPRPALPARPRPVAPRPRTAYPASPWPGPPAPAYPAQENWHVPPPEGSTGSTGSMGSWFIRE